MSLTNKRPFYCGTSNVELPVPNKSFFPAAFQGKSRLSYYASLFNSVEINSSFYKIPMRRTVEKWAAEVPGEFRFTVKLWKGITHTKELAYDSADLDRFMAAVNGIGTKKGCLLVQLPASIKISCFENLHQLLDRLRDGDEINQWKLAIEFRDKTWYDKPVYRLLDRYGAAVVIHDMPRSATPFIDLKADFIYLRFHGELGDYKGSYDDTYLEKQAAYARDCIKHGKTVFAYFNNTIGAAVGNALVLQEKTIAR